MLDTSYLQVTRTSITSRTSSKFGQIEPRTAELAALERMKKSHRLIIITNNLLRNVLTTVIKDFY